MDIVEFVELIANVDLPSWQKDHIRKLYDLSQHTDIRIVMPKDNGRKQAYIYMNQIKELISNGSPNHS